jgi:hypothetical protein
MDGDCPAPPKTIRTSKQPIDRAQMKKAGVDACVMLLTVNLMPDIDLVVVFASTGGSECGAPVDYRARRLPQPPRRYEWHEIDGRSILVRYCPEVATVPVPRKRYVLIPMGVLPISLPHEAGAKRRPSTECVL